MNIMTCQLHMIYLSKRVADTIDTSKQQQKRRATKNNTGWWFGTMELYVSIQVGMSSSLSEGQVYHQPDNKPSPSHHHKEVVQTSTKWVVYDGLNLIKQDLIINELAKTHQILVPFPRSNHAKHVRGVPQTWRKPASWLDFERAK